jgi:hypothetical protein
MTTTIQSRGAMRLVRRYPRIGGLLLAAIGLVMTWQSVQAGRTMARFAGGAQAEGRVIGVENVGAGLPEFRLNVAWVDSAGVEQIAATRVFKREFENLRPGERVELLVARDDPGAVVLERIFDRAGLVSLGPTSATPLVFAGVPVFLGGVFLLATGSRFLRG